MPSVVTEHDVARAIVIIATIGITIQSLELLYELDQLKDSRPFDWSILRTGRSWTVTGLRARLLDFIYRGTCIRLLITVQLAAAVVLLATQGSAAIAKPCVPVILATLLLLHFRLQYGMDGADQMQVIIFGALTAFYVISTPLVQLAAIGFIGAQSLLSYFTSGYAKLVSPVWRGGAAVGGILTTASYGSPVAVKVLVGNPGLSRTLSWATLLFECGCPFLVLLGPSRCIIFIAIGITFHIGIAVSMGLNDFVWAFVATYPALLFFSYHINLV